MKKRYIIPEVEIVRLQSNPLFYAISGYDDDDSDKSKEFEGPTGFLWEEESNEE